jgi:LacI family transcriptional regulator
VILGDVGSAYVGEVGLGLRQATAGHPRWSIRLQRQLDFTIRLQPDVILAQVVTQASEAALLQLGVPVVNFSGWLARSRVPRVGVDNPAVGRLAAEHLMQRGFSQLAGSGQLAADHSRQRIDGFTQAVTQNGRTLLAAPPRLDEAIEADAASSQTLGRQLRDWADAAAGPVGLFVTNDTFAARYLDAFLKIGVHVPTEVAVLGVDDDELLCELCDPPLSSIRLPGEQIGVTAAHVLGEMLAGRALDRHEWLLKPAGVRVRQSTDVQAVHDPLVAEAMDTIRRRFPDDLGAADVAAQADISRRMFELRFKKAMGHTVGHQILLQRLDHAKQLLGTTDRRITQIAFDCGFSAPQRLNEAFRRVLGTSPSAYRRQRRATR